MTIIDRYLLRQFYSSFIVVYFSLVGLYIIIDMMTNVDELMERTNSVGHFVQKTVNYYWIHSFEYFDRLAPIITSVAAMATLASLHRYNEIIALLAAGIPTKRLLVPIFVGVVSIIGFGVINKEFILPHYSILLQRLHEDDGEQLLIPTSQIDRDQVLFRAQLADRVEQKLADARLTLPDFVTLDQGEIASTAVFWRQEPGGSRWGWLVTKPTPRPTLRPQNEKAFWVEDKDLFIYSNVTFADMIRRANWINFASTRELLDKLYSDETRGQMEIRIQMHNRFMAPVMNFLLVLLGIPFVLEWEQKNVYRSVALAVAFAGFFLVVQMVAGYFSLYGYLEPAMAAWLPVFLFAPIAFSLLHRIGT